MTSFSASHYQQQLDEKQQTIQLLFAEFALPAIRIYPSPISHYRMRAEFRIWHHGEALYHIMYDKHNKRRVRVDQFPVACQLINRAMQAIIPGLKSDLLLRDQLFQIDYLATESQQLLITLLYHKKLDESWTTLATRLRHQLQQQGFNLQLVGRSSKQKICIEQDVVDEQFTLAEHTLIYRQAENCFTQPNAAVNKQMLMWAKQQTKALKGDLLELYCGNGNFSIALASNFRQVLATEISKPSVNVARYNIKANQLDNVTIVRMSAEELTQAMSGERTFKRLKAVDLSQFDCQTVLIDPPRSGIDKQTLAIIKNYHNILYISCNPNSLKANLHELIDSHHIVSWALFDQFPYTDHIESGVFLQKR